MYVHKMRRSIESNKHFLKIYKLFLLQIYSAI